MRSFGLSMRSFCFYVSDGADDWCGCVCVCVFVCVATLRAMLKRQRVYLGTGTLKTNWESRNTGFLHSVAEFAM